MDCFLSLSKNCKYTTPMQFTTHNFQLYVICKLLVIEKYMTRNNGHSIRRTRIGHHVDACQKTHFNAGLKQKATFCIPQTLKRNILLVLSITKVPEPLRASQMKTKLKRKKKKKRKQYINVFILYSEKLGTYCSYCKNSQCSLKSK